MAGLLQVASHAGAHHAKPDESDLHRHSSRTYVIRLWSGAGLCSSRRTEVTQPLAAMVQFYAIFCDPHADHRVWLGTQGFDRDEEAVTTHTDRRVPQILPEGVRDNAHDEPIVHQHIESDWVRCLRQPAPAIELPIPYP